jgi:hypothetical protein
MVLALAVGCDSSSPAPKTAAAEKAAPAEAATPAEDAATPTDEAAADHEGCIYAEGEKDAGDKAECPHPPAGIGEAGEPQGPATGEGHFGSPFSLASADAKPLGKAVGGAADGPLLITGEVEAVCQKKGCWMVVKDGEVNARVLMKDHGFAVPMDCRGKTVTIEGELSTRTFTEAQVKHLAKDGGKDPAEVSGEKTEHVLTASGVEIVAKT